MKMQVPLGKPQPWVLPVTLVCLALGALIASLLNVAPPDSPDPNLRPEEMARYYKKQYEISRSENEELRKNYNKAIDMYAGDQKARKVLLDELNSLRIRAGAAVVEGPGIVITIDDSGIMKSNPSDPTNAARLTHDLDLLMLVNELRSAGAEAISLNEERVVGVTAIRCVGPVIHVNNHPVSAPFTLKAIGKSDVLAGAINLPFGVLDQLKPLGIAVSVVKRDKLRLPAITLPQTPNMGKVATE